MFKISSRYKNKVKSKINHLQFKIQWSKSVIIITQQNNPTALQLVKYKKKQQKKQKTFDNATFDYYMSENKSKTTLY